MRRTKHILLSVALAGSCLAAGCDTSDPGNPDQQPLYRTENEGAPSSGERGNMMISEINFAGSVTDDGVRDPDDIFIELQNKHPRPINVSQWHLIVEGPESDRAYRIPDIQEPIQPNEYFVIAKKSDGAFGEVADVVIEDLKLPLPYFELQLRGVDRELMNGAGSDDERVFAGGYDGYTVRSMERIQLIFSNNGGVSASWHAYSGIRRADGRVDHIGLDTVAEGWRQRTLASPGESNSTDYSGSTSSGGFE
ncbi:MAG: hypothetical protein ACQEVA_22060 [Myxococcota bacterium]